MKLQILTFLLALTLTLSSARVAPRLSIGGNVSQSSSIGGANNTGLVGNIIDNSGNNGIIQNVGHQESPRGEASTEGTATRSDTPQPRLSIGGNDNANNVIGLNNGTGNIIDNSGNEGDLHNSDQNNNGGLVVKAPRISIGGDNNQNNVIGANNGQGNIIDNSGNSGSLVNEGQNNNGGIAVDLPAPSSSGATTGTGTGTGMLN